MTDSKTARPRGRPPGTALALSGRRWLALITELRHGAGSVNLAATAREFGISRGTLLRYIKEEPGLLETIQARRATNGRGYVPVKRGTRKSRAAAKARRESAQSLPSQAEPDRIPPPAVMASLNAFLHEHDSWQAYIAEGAGEAVDPRVDAAIPTVQGSSVSTKVHGYAVVDLFGPVMPKKDRKRNGF